MKTLATILTALLVLPSCARHIVRDAKVYQVEQNQYEAWALQSAAHLKNLIKANCKCTNMGEFTSFTCKEAADLALTMEARASWHKAMSLYNGSIVDVRPDKNPPKIPANSTLCPNI